MPVQCSAKAANPTVAHYSDMIEPLFLNRKKWLTHPPTYLGQVASQYLSHCVARTPHDLSNHVYRIRFHLMLRQSEQTTGALIDLFLVLKDKGVPLKVRMLQQCKSLIDPEHYNFLTIALQDPLQPTDNLPQVGNAVLARGVSGSTTIVIRVKTEQENRAELDVLQESRELIDIGRIKEAQLLLEHAIISAAYREELHHGLLEIYHHTRNLEDLQRMLNHLKRNPPPNIHAWQALAVQLKNYADVGH